MSKLDFGFNQWSVVSFVVKKLYVYLFMVKQCIYLVILMYFMQLYSHLLWSGNKFADFVVFLNFLSTPHAAWIIKKTKFWEDSKSQDKSFANKRDKSDY